MDKERIEELRKRGTGDILADIEKLKMTPEERIKDLLERIEYEYKYDAGYYGTLDEDEAAYRYNLLLDALPNMPGVTAQNIQYLTSLIQEKIIDISRFELARINAILNNKESLHQRIINWARVDEISYDEAKRNLLSNLKEKADKHSKILEENKKTPVTPGNGEQGDGEQGDEGNR